MGATPTAQRGERRLGATVGPDAAGLVEPQVGANHRVAVATSGGRDSTALLHSTARAGKALGIEVVALHVHHGLQPQADTWLSGVHAQARRWGLKCLSTKVQSKPARGESVEAWARRERYAALAHMAQQAQCGIVLLAHHRGDQAETFLLQALRGAGSAGLAAMPRSAERGGITWARPWLNQPREAIEAYVRRHRLSYVDDPSNADPRWDRNRLRIQVWPALRAAFPQAEASLAAAAERMAHEAAALHSQAMVNLDQVQSTSWVASNRTLNVKAWLELPQAQRQPTLRLWLADLQAGPARIPHTLITRLMTGLQLSVIASWPWGLGWLRLYRGALRFEPGGQDGASAGASALQDAAPARSKTKPLPTPLTMDLSQPGRYAVAAWGGHLQVDAVEQGGVPSALLRNAQLCPREGGEVFRLTPRGTDRSLKKQFQSRAVAAWDRAGPLVFSSADELLFVPGLGMNAAHQGTEFQTLLMLKWWAAGIKSSTGS